MRAIGLALVLGGCAASLPPELAEPTCGGSDPVPLKGGFERPGEIEWRPGLTLGEAVAEVGGVTRFGDRHLLLRRREGGRLGEWEVDVDEIPELPLCPGDELYSNPHECFGLE